MNDRDSKALRFLCLLPVFIDLYTETIFFSEAADTSACVAIRQVTLVPILPVTTVPPSSYGIRQSCGMAGNLNQSLELGVGSAQLAGGGDLQTS